MIKEVSNNKYQFVTDPFLKAAKFELTNIPELNVRLKIDKKVYLFNRHSIIKTIEENLSYAEKVEFYQALTILRERSSNLTHYLSIFLTGVINRKEYK